MSTIFNGDSQMEVVTVLANCGTDIDRAKQALTTYIVRKQEKGRSTEHILVKLRRLESKFINDTTLHAAFRDARALTFLPRSPDLPLPDFVVRREAAARRDSLSSSRSSALRDTAITAGPSLSLPTSQNHVQLSSSRVQPAQSCIAEETRIQPAGPALLTRASLPPANSPRNLDVPSEYIHANSSSRSRSLTLPSLTPLLFTRASSSNRLQSSFNPPAPTTPLPDIPDDQPDDYDPYIPRLTQSDHRHISWCSQSSSSSHSSYLSPRTPANTSGPPPYPGFYSKSAAIIRGDNYPPQRTERPPVVVEHDLSETSIPSMLFPNPNLISEDSGAHFPVSDRDSPVLRDRPTGRNFSFSLDNALRSCGASLVVRREVSKCLQQDRGYEQYTWLTVLQECGIAEEDIPFLLNEMAREAESIHRG